MSLNFGIKFEKIVHIILLLTNIFTEIWIFGQSPAWWVESGIGMSTIYLVITTRSRNPVLDAMLHVSTALGLARELYQVAGEVGCHSEYP